MKHFRSRSRSAGIVFIGPNPKAIAAMGDKIESKKAAARAKVSTVPGHLGVIEDEAQAVRIAEEIGFPVMIKASAGGGGKGMRIAHSSDEVAEGFARARSEAKSSFGDDRVFIEKFIVDPRHVEIQVLGDKHGNVIYLGERECSIQRRNQKVLEEAPSPLLDEATRARMGEQAVALAKAVGYDSAGTVEFVGGSGPELLFPGDEHAAAGRASGDRAGHRHRSRRADDPRRRRRAARASRRATSSLPAGRSRAGSTPRTLIATFCRRSAASRAIDRRPRPRTNDVTVRNDTGVYEGGEISIYYDPMIAKLVTHAPTRAAAIDAQAQALDAFYIDGIRHNIPFLSAVMHNPRWRAGALSTGFIAEEFPNGFHPIVPQGEQARLIAAVAAAIDHVIGERKRRISGQMGGRLVTRERRRAVWLGDVEMALSVAREAGGIAVRFIEDGAEGPARILTSAWKPGEPVWTGTVRWHAGGRAGAPDPQRVSARARRGRGQGLCLHRARGGGGTADAEQAAE